MFKKLVIVFDKKYEQFVRQTHLKDLQNIQTEMAVHRVSVMWSFVEPEHDETSRQEASIDNRLKNETSKGEASKDKKSKDEATSEDILAGEALADSLYLVDNPVNLDVLKLWGYYAIALIHGANQDTRFKNARYIIEGLEGLDYDYLKQVYQRLAGQPWDILETERLKVRESTPEDVKDFYRIYKDPSITYYMENLFEDPDQECAYIKDYTRYVYGLYGYGMWTVILKETGEVIGRAGISIREGYDEPELGFVIEVAHQRKGYAGEVCQAILDYAEKKLQMGNIQALVCAANEASIKVLRKLGFSYCKDVSEEGKEYQLWKKCLAKINR